ncbi:MAG: GNAT family N-acetyltransferase [Sulfurospirillaceae bacterium]|nr:GNAT family N-acetyltransferase [Sulfurospirillaceae bacterium]
MEMKRTSNADIHFQILTQHLDQELNARYGALQSSYDKHNVIVPIETALVGFDETMPVACGCFKVIDDKTVEIKRMFVLSEYRRQGISTQMLHALEQWAISLGYCMARLETGKRQPEAIGLYQKYGYEIIDNFEPYRGIDNSVCMQKTLRSE